ncbi:MAG: glutathione peroxidase [Candidatus Binatia bacterium]
MPKDRRGQRVPEAVFRTRRGTEWVDVTSRQLFAGKKVVVFALPGAFTPTCSSTHLPRFEELVPAFRQAGVDDVVCISVNDAFVMNAWGEAQDVRHVRLVPDGNGTFTEAMGMLVDKDDLGFGRRSWRYSMLVEDGVIRKMFIEPELPGDPFEVSDADTMLAWIRPGARPDDVAIVTKPGCPFCARAREALRTRGIPFEEIVVGKDVSPRSLRAVSGGATVPQVFVNGRCIGGSVELEAWLG